MSDREDRTRRLEQEEFERGRRRPGEEPADPLPSATLVLARPSGAGEDGGMEVLLLRRPEDAGFAAGAHVFPGGRIEPQDRDEGVAERTGSEAADGEPAALAAAVRELFEEAGVLLAAPRPAPRELERARERLLDGELELGELLDRFDLRLPGTPVAYFARWITPEELSRRYDTRFFLARHPGGEVRVGAEHTGARWVSPAAALDRFDAGSLPMLFPTRKTLELLEGAGEPGEAVGELGARRVRPVRPRLVEGEDGVVPVLPGDPRYPAD